MAYVEKNAGTADFATIFAGTEIPALTTSVTIATGQGELKRGAVLGVITASGKCALVDKESGDGSEVAKYVLAEDVDATSADVDAVVWKTGIFRYGFLYVAEGGTVADHAEELRAVNIHYRDEY